MPNLFFALILHIQNALTDCLHTMCQRAGFAAHGLGYLIRGIDVIQDIIKSIQEPIRDANNVKWINAADGIAVSLVR